MLQFVGLQSQIRPRTYDKGNTWLYKYEREGKTLPCSRMPANKHRRKDGVRKSPTSAKTQGENLRNRMLLVQKCLPTHDLLIAKWTV